MSHNQADGVDDTVNAPFTPIAAPRAVPFAFEGKVDIKTMSLEPRYSRRDRKRLAKMLGAGWIIMNVETRFMLSSRYTFARPKGGRK